jgi:outer membrane protein assembly factor BamB
MRQLTISIRRKEILNRRCLLIVIMSLAIVIAAASLAILYERGLLTSSTEPESRGTLWLRNIKNFATGLTAFDEKVYTIDVWGNICCYEAQSGESVWNGSIGAYWGAGVAASSTRVYGGKASAEVGALDSITGKFQWSADTQLESSWSKRSPSNITVLEGRLYVTAYSFNVFNATTGQLLWEYENIPFRSDSNVTDPNQLRGWPFEGNRVFAVGGVILEGWYVYRVDPNDGNILWSLPRSTSVNGPPVVYQGQVIMRNSSGGKTTVFSLSEDSGAILWSYNVEASVYPLTATSTGLLLFEASDGNVYALHLSNGTLSWNAPVDSQNITALANSDNPLKGLQIQIDSLNQMAIGGFAITTQLGAFLENGSDEYCGFLYGLDIETGSIIWTTQFSADGDVSHEGANFDFVMNENNLYLASGFSDFWIFRKSMGELIASQHLDHYILPPIVSNNRVFVAADLHLIAYG